MPTAICQCEIYQTCAECRGTDRDPVRWLKEAEQKAMQEALRKSVRKIGRGKDLRKPQQ